MVRLEMFTFPVVLEAVNPEDLLLFVLLTKKTQRMHSELWMARSWMAVKLKFRKPEKEERKIHVKL
jgi:hypothetical protein